MIPSTECLLHAVLCHLNDYVSKRFRVTGFANALSLNSGISHLSACFLRKPITALSMPHIGTLPALRASNAKFVYVTCNTHHGEAPAIETAIVLFIVPHNSKRRWVATIKCVIITAVASVCHFVVITGLMGCLAIEVDSKATMKRNTKESGERRGLRGTSEDAEPTKGRKEKERWVLQSL